MSVVLTVLTPAGSRPLPLTDLLGLIFCAVLSAAILFGGHALRSC